MQTRNPIYTLIAASARCTKCDAPMSEGCKCWVKLVCEKCGAETADERIPEYGDLDVVETTCPNCNGDR